MAIKQCLRRSRYNNTPALCFALTAAIQPAATICVIFSGRLLLLLQAVTLSIKSINTTT